MTCFSSRLFLRIARELLNAHFRSAVVSSETAIALFDGAVCYLNQSIPISQFQVIQSHEFKCEVRRLEAIRKYIKIDHSPINEFDFDKWNFFFLPSPL